MRSSVTTAMKAFLTQSVRTIATVWLITRKDGQIFGFTDHDANILYNGIMFESAIGYTASAIDMSSDLSTSNMEIDCLLDSSVILTEDVEAGLWSSALVTISMVNYANLSMGAVILTNGRLGQFTLSLGALKAELRNLSQIMQQQLSEVYSSSCRASLGDSRCTVALGPLTATGVPVTSIGNVLNIGATSLTQVGPTVPFKDTVGQLIPTTIPTIQIVPPTGGQFVADLGVFSSSGAQFTNVGSSGSPGATGEYTCTPTGLYTFYNGGTGSNAGNEVFIDYSYSIGYFAYGVMKFTSGQNTGYSMDLSSFSPGNITLFMPFPYPIEIGDLFTITAGCDRLPGTCSGRFNNLVNFRGEPFIPGNDTLLRPQVSSS